VWGAFLAAGVGEIIHKSFDAFGVQKNIAEWLASHQMKSCYQAHVFAGQSAVLNPIANL